jgi:D-3-phosphoglycerate dehydrogenase
MATILVPHPVGEMRLLYGNSAITQLSSLGHVRLNESPDHWQPDELLAAAVDCDVIVSFGVTPGTPALFEALPLLKAFVRWAVDIRNIDVVAASRTGVLVTRGPAVFTAGVSELILGMMLDLTRKIAASTESYHAGTIPLPGIYRELRGSTLGVIGFGQISRYLCDIALAMGMRIIVSDPYVSVDNPRIEQVSFETMLGEADYVVCLATATPETESLMCAKTFGAMKPTAYFINLSRGNLVDETDLVAALDKGVIAGAAIDVGRAYRQMPSPAVARHPKVIATPHIGGLTPASIETQHREAVRQVRDILAGVMPERAVNGASASRLRLSPRP